jgi:hypothetical protein
MEAHEQRSSPRYAVVFRAGAETPVAGALVTDEDRLVLEGRGRDGSVELRIPYQELTGVRVGRSAEERLNGRPALLLERGDEPLVQVEPLGVGLLQELAHLLAALSTGNGEAEEQVEVVVPLKKDRLGRARELVAEGPPFDPAALGLRRHEVFLTTDEAIFVFVGRGVRRTLQRATRDPSLWRVGLAWRDCIGGRPHLAAEAKMGRTRSLQPVYTWTASRL